MRGVAALLVVLIHGISAPDKVVVEWIAPYFYKWGPGGVDLFFVISGFIISTVATEQAKKSGEISRWDVVREFLLKRFIRIYPIYWIALAVASFLGGYFLLSAPFLPARPFWQLFFLLDIVNNRIMAAWSLVYEMYFYMIIGMVMLAFRKQIFLGLSIWGVISVYIVFYCFYNRPELLSNVVTSPLLFEFMFGVFIAFLVSRNGIVFPLTCILLGTAGFFIGGHINLQLGDWLPMNRAFLLGVPSALLIYGMIAIELRYGWACARPWQELGNASFSLYIWHQTIIYSGYGLLRKLHWFEILNRELMAGTLIAISIGWAFVSYRYLERPLQQHLTSFFIGSSRRQPGLRMNYNYVFYAALAALLGGAFLAPNLDALAHGWAPKRVASEEIGSQGERVRKLLAAWPAEGGASHLEFTGRPDLPAPAVLKLPTDYALARSQVEIHVAGTGNGALYVGYASHSKTVEQWIAVNPGENRLTVDVQDVDSGVISLSKDYGRPGFEITSLALFSRP